MYLGDLRRSFDDTSPVTMRQRRLLEKVGIFSPYDLFTYFPFRYENRKEISSIEASLQQHAPVAVVVKVIEHDHIYFQKKRHPKIIVTDERMRAVLVGFHRPYLIKQLRIGERYWLYAQFTMKYNEIQAANFEFEPYQGEVDGKHFGKIFPVYRLPAEMYLKEFHTLLNKHLDTYVPQIEDEIPSYAVSGHKLLSKAEAYREIHFPTDFDRLRKARLRIAYEEVFAIAMAVQLKRRAVLSYVKERRYNGKGKSMATLQNLPFVLTEGQVRALEDIDTDLFSSRPMHRLLQGDVGAGKTVVAFYAMMVASENGHQAALLVPTESLAFQHYASLQRLVGDEFSTALLTSSTPAPERRSILSRLQDGSLSLIVGTHALLQPDVVWKDLSVVVFDEQHKFGVEQRIALARKGDHPDLLVMTATPIPRTITLTLYGDLDISVMKDKPKNRLPIRTHWMRPSGYRAMIDFIKKELDRGRQAFFVYPVIEASEKLDLKSLEHYYVQIQQRFHTYKVVWIHGRMPSEEKQRHLDSFRLGEVHILVSTIVIEVGIDVPNATVMVIEAADRFGLSQLHQLRGRVGRGEHQSFCFLATDDEITEEGKERMEVMCRTSDGFEIAEADFRQRGPGTILGVRQSGLSDLKMTDLCDHRFLAMCMEDTKRIITYDPDLALPKHRCIVDGILKFLPVDYLQSG